MGNLGSKVGSAARAVREGRADDIITTLKERWGSEIVAYGLRRDITVPFEPPDALYPIKIRPLEPADVPRLLDPDTPSIVPQTREEIVTRRQMLDAGLRTCYVAVKESGEPCYMQWLIGPAQNDLMQRYFHGLYPVLQQDEALLEGAFTPEAFRGQRIMPAAMARIAAMGKEIGARHVITFVTVDNVPSLKGCKRANFWPYLTRTDRWRGFARRIEFAPLAEGTGYPPGV